MYYLSKKGSGTKSRQSYIFYLSTLKCLRIAHSTEWLVGDKGDNVLDVLRIPNKKRDNPDIG